MSWYMKGIHCRMYVIHNKVNVLCTKLDRYWSLNKLDNIMTVTSDWYFVNLCVGTGRVFRSLIWQASGQQDAHSVQLPLTLRNPPSNFCSAPCRACCRHSFNIYVLHQFISLDSACIHFFHHFSCNHHLAALLHLFTRLMFVVVVQSLWYRIVKGENVLLLVAPRSRGAL